MQNIYMADPNISQELEGNLHRYANYEPVKLNETVMGGSSAPCVGVLDELALVGSPGSRLGARCIPS